MTESESVALPFGDGPLRSTKTIIGHASEKSKPFFQLFLFFCNSSVMLLQNGGFELYGRTVPIILFLQIMHAYIIDRSINRIIEPLGHTDLILNCIIEIKFPDRGMDRTALGNSRQAHIGNINTEFI